jgi:lysine 2,3-aminomutase
VSGGDPLTLSTARLDHILGRLRQIDHLDVVRLGTRNPVTLPQRIDSPLLEILARHAPIYLNTHFNHPNEASAEAEAALKGLREAGCILGNQMVLLAGVNDDGPTVERLNRWLLRHGCRPYYILQADMAQGITHFRTPLEQVALRSCATFGADYRAWASLNL